MCSCQKKFSVSLWGSLTLWWVLSLSQFSSINKRSFITREAGVQQPPQQHVVISVFRNKKMAKRVTWQCFLWHLWHPLPHNLVLLILVALLCSDSATGSQVCPFPSCRAQSQSPSNTLSLPRHLPQTLCTNLDIIIKNTAFTYPTDLLFTSFVCVKRHTHVWALRCTDHVLRLRQRDSRHTHKVMTKNAVSTWSTDTMIPLSVVRVKGGLSCCTSATRTKKATFVSCLELSFLGQ